MKSKPLYAAVIFLAGSTACSDAEHSLPEQPAEQVAHEISQPGSVDPSTFSSSLRLPRQFVQTPVVSQQITPPPMYTMSNHTPPRDVLVWKHDWEFVQGPSGEDSSLFGATLNAIGDVNGDGFDDFAAGGWENDVDVYVFHGRTDTFGDSANLQIPTPQEGSQFGFSIASAGDVNGDGFGDVIIGAPAYTPNPEEVAPDEENPPTEGAAYLYMGSADGLDATPAAQWYGSTPTDQFGRTVDSAGDVNRDGFDDIAIGAPFAPAEDGSPQAGAVHIYHGSENGLADATEPVVLAAPEPGIAFGFSVAGVGDTNGDAFDDVLVGAIGFSEGEQFEGGAFVFQGSQDGLSSTPDWQAAGANVQEAYFGWRVDAGGDINNDGFNDVIIGAPRYTSDPNDETQAYEGAVFAYMGSESGLGADFDWQIESDRTEGFLGSDVSGGHDVNGDGFDDVLIADAHYGLVSFGGELYLGSANGLQDDFAWQAIYEGNSTIGDTARFVGDVNGDGYGDMLLGGPYFSSIYLYYGAPCFDADWDTYKGYNAVTCTAGDDCYDLDNKAYPGAPLRCDGLDTACTGVVDEGCDDDADGYCDASIPAWAPAGPPSTCPEGMGDCDDDDSEHNPGSPELCNFMDDDCNNKIDEEPKVCGDEQICYQGGCYNECTADSDCEGDQGCYGGRCTADPCEGVVCPDRREECFMGTCQVTCQVNSVCAWDDKQCIDGRCAVDPCDGVLCRTSEVCEEGQCVPQGGQSGEDAGNADAGQDAGQDTGPSGDQGSNNNNNNDDGGCSTTPGSVPPSGVMLLLVTLGGLVWRRRS